MIGILTMILVPVAVLAIGYVMLGLHKSRKGEAKK